jgi:hypothetical protein
MKLEKRFIDRFWKRVQKCGPMPEHLRKLGRCWLWVAGTHPRGYGMFSAPGCNYAHRFSWMIHKGGIPKGLEICHHCDNPSCVRPTHLFCGTHADNMHDLRDKGLHRPARGVKHGLHLHPERAPMGERNSHAKLTQGEVVFIRRFAAQGNSHKRLAEIYGMGVSAISSIVRRRTWKHVM